MRFIGGKSLLLENIGGIIESNTNGVVKVGDLFTGSGIVSSYFKQSGYEVIANDIMYMSYCLSRGMIELNEQVVDNSMFDYLNNLPEPSDKSACFIYNNYSPNENCDRMYFQPDNALKIDSIRIELERLKSNEVVDDSAYYYLLACLLSAVPYVANITGVYAAYLKHWDIRTYNKLELKPLPIIKSNKSCRAYNLDAKKVGSLESFDLVYIDTPYNSRQYLPNYHILETIAKYDYPEIKGVTGMRDYVRSDFCQKNKVMGAFYDLLNSLKTRYVLLSYNTEGLITTEEMFDILSNYGVVKLFEFPYRRYKSKIPNNTDGLKEQIYFVEVTR